MEKWALVTGAGSGIGRAITHELVRAAGLHVLAVGRRKKPLQETQKFDPDHIHVLSADIALEKEREKIVAALPEKADLLFVIHNAAVLEPVKPLAQIQLEEWRHHFAINVEGPLFLTQALLAHLNDGARILHISSGAAHHPYAGWGAYCTSKAALFMLYRVLNAELNARGIFVGSLRPGVVNTPMQDQVRRARPEFFPTLERFIQLKQEGKLIDPQLVARFAVAILQQTDNETFAAEEWDIRDHAEQFGIPLDVKEQGQK